jgi:hypothetical protein
VSEQRLMKYGPGDEIEVLLRIQHAPMHLGEVSARFFPESQEGQGRVIDYVYMSGRPRVSEEQPAPQLYPGLMLSEVSMSATVAPEFAPGIYRLNRVTVTTYGGREHRYSADDLGNADALGFEIVEEPDDRPALQIRVG